MKTTTTLMAVIACVLFFSSCVSYQSVSLENKDNHLLQLQGPQYISTERIKCTQKQIPVYYYVDSIVGHKYGKNYYANDIRADYKLTSLFGLKSNECYAIVFDVYFLSKTGKTGEPPVSSVSEPSSGAVTPIHAVTPVVVKKDTLNYYDMPADFQWIFRNYNPDFGGTKKIVSDFTDIRSIDLSPDYIRSKIKYNSELRFLAILILAKSNYSVDVPREIKKVLEGVMQKDNPPVDEKTNLKSLKNITQKDLNNMRVIYKMLGSLAIDE